MRNIAFIMLAAMLVAYGCYPGGGSTTDDYTIVRTQYNTGYEFGKQKYYYMPDSMMFQTNIDDDKIDWDKYEAYETTLLAEIEAQMAGRNYTRTNDSTILDLVVLPSAVLSENSGSVWWPGGGWWGGYYPPGWGWGGGWYYPPGYGGYWTAYSYTTGTVFITLLDYDSYYEGIGDTPTIEVEWDATIDGLFNGVNATKIKPLVEQAFTQSPYLISNIE